jgi:hypothetical protein
VAPTAAQALFYEHGAKPSPRLSSARLTARPCPAHPPGPAREFPFRFWRPEEVPPADFASPEPAPGPDTLAALLTGVYSGLQAKAGKAAGVAPGAAWRAALEAATENGAAQFILGERPLGGRGPRRPCGPTSRRRAPRGGQGRAARGGGGHQRARIHPLVPCTAACAAARPPIPTSRLRLLPQTPCAPPPAPPAGDRPAQVSQRRLADAMYASTAARLVAALSLLAAGAAARFVPGFEDLSGLIPGGDASAGAAAFGAAAAAAAAVLWPVLGPLVEVWRFSQLDGPAVEAAVAVKEPIQVQRGWGVS